MKSSMVVFVLAFAAMGLLIGLAASMDVEMLQGPPAFRTNGGDGNSINGTSIGIEEQVTAQVNRSSSSPSPSGQQQQEG